MIITTSKQLHGPKPVRVDEKDLKSLEDCDCTWFLFWFMIFFGNEDKGLMSEAQLLSVFLIMGNHLLNVVLQK